MTALPAPLKFAVLVAAVGYFVDIYDLVLFSIVRVPSLEAIGFKGQALVDQGAFLLNVQMFGMLLGGIVWGILGDWHGRVSVLFGSILLYSAANLANAFAEELPQFVLLRFFAGLGLAGELGAGITLVAEMLPTNLRGNGAAIVAGFGVLGAVAANAVAEHLSWRGTYVVGGLLGLMILCLRTGTLESRLFDQVLRRSDAVRGRFASLFSDPLRLRRYACCILVGLPLWYVVGILITFSPEFARLLGVPGQVSAGRAVMYCYLGFAGGDVLSGFASEALRNRKQIIRGYLAGLSVVVLIYFSWHGMSLRSFYVVCFFLGFSGGYWAVLLMMSAEQFGTNLRATATTTVPNFIRGALILLTTLFQLTRPWLGTVGGAALTGVLTLGAALLALSQLEETRGKSLDFLEN